MYVVSVNKGNKAFSQHILTVTGLEESCCTVTGLNTCKRMSAQLFFIIVSQQKRFKRVEFQPGSS